MNERGLATVAAWGTLLTLVVLAASVLLRLATTLDADFNAATILSPAVEKGVRLTHRVAASGVTLLALAAVLSLRLRPVPFARGAAVAAILALTAFLSLIGLYATGYRFAWVTVGNVAGGVALACAFWWLRATFLPAPGPRVDPFAAAALAVVLVHAACGAAARAVGMVDGPRLDPWHIAPGPLVAAIAATAALRALPGRPAAASAVLALAVLQLALGIALASQGASVRALAWAWPHAFVGALLALGLVTLAASRGDLPSRR